MELEQLKIDRDSARAPARRKRSSGWVTVLVLAVLLGLVGWLFRRRIETLVLGLTTPEVKVARVVEHSAASVAAASGTSANGYIVARTRAALSADTPGRIVEMNVEEGSVVKKGQVVARLYSDEFAANVEQAKSQVEVAKAVQARAEADVVTAQKNLSTVKSEVDATAADIAQYEASVKLAQVQLDRAKSLLQSQVDTVDRVDRAQKDLEEAQSRIVWAKARHESAVRAVAESESRIEAARSAVLEARARVTSAEASRALAQATLDKAQVRAPFDGIVVLKDAEVGEVVSPNSQGGSNARGSIVTMVDFASLEVQVDLQETSLNVAHEGVPVTVYLDAWPDRHYAGRVRRVWPTANRQKATVEVRVSIDDPDDKLRPEMGARVVFQAPGASDTKATVAKEPALLVTRGAIVRVENTDNVFVVERDVARLRPVVLGGERSGQVVVKSGLAAGEQVIENPPASLRDGDRVRTGN